LVSIDLVVLQKKIKHQLIINIPAWPGELKTHLFLFIGIKNTLAVFEIRLLNLLARKLQNHNIYIDSIEKIWQKSLVQINFHWPWATGPLLKSMTALDLFCCEFKP
jgi:hypothetical protein